MRHPSGLWSGKVEWVILMARAACYNQFKTQIELEELNNDKMSL